jgi:hypothetical protein
MSLLRKMYESRPTAKDYDLSGDAAEIFDALMSYKSVNVKTDAGNAFMIKPVDAAGAPGYKIIPKGKKKMIKSSPLMSSDQLAQWVSTLKLDK